MKAKAYACFLCPVIGVMSFYSNSIYFVIVYY